MTLNFTVPLEISLLTERLYLLYVPHVMVMVERVGWQCPSCPSALLVHHGRATTPVEGCDRGDLLITTITFYPPHHIAHNTSIRDGFARATALLGMAVTLSTCQLRSGSTDDSNVSLCLRGRRIGTTPLLGTEDCFDCFCDESLGFHTGARPQVCSCGWSLRRKLQRIAIARQGWQNDNGNLRQLVHNVVRLLPSARNLA